MLTLNFFLKLAHGTASHLVSAAITILKSRVGSFSWEVNGTELDKFN
jgi:hypothetical protein